MEVTNRFRGLELINSVPEELWTEVHKLYRKQLTKPSPKKRKARRQSGYLRRAYKYLKTEEKGKAKEKGKGISN